MNMWVVSTVWLLKPIIYQVLSPSCSKNSTVSCQVAPHTNEVGTVVIPFMQTGKGMGSGTCLSEVVSASGLKQ